MRKTSVWPLAHYLVSGLGIAVLLGVASPAARAVEPECVDADGNPLPGVNTSQGSEFGWDNTTCHYTGSAFGYNNNSSGVYGTPLVI